MMNKNCYFIAMILASTSLMGRDILFEFKGAYFLATGSNFKRIYDHGGALYGPEVTWELCRNFYGFASVDHLQKKGRSIGFCSPTKVDLVPLGIGLKYFVPFCHSDRINGDFYVGLGFQPTHLRTTDCSPYVIKNHSKWGFGGIAKIGTYFNLPHHLFIDIFVDYSFVKVPFCNSKACTGPVAPLKADISGVIFGGGFGYRFN